MRVLIDGFYLNKPRGMGRYIQEMLYAIGKNKPDGWDIYVAVPKSVPQKDYILRDVLKYQKFQDLPFPIWEQFLIPFIAVKRQVSVVHSPYNTKPLLFNLGYQPHVVTIHDLIYMQDGHKAKSLYQKIGNLYRKCMVSLMCSNSQTTITDSYHSATEISTILDFDAHVVYIPIAYSKILEERQISDVLAQKPYFYHIGGTSPHKNTEGCIEAFLASGLTENYMIVSGMSEDSDLAIKYRSNNIIFTGWISDELVATYYRNALAVVFPSFCEGYGLPIIEAFTYGSPLITSNLNPMKEIAGGAAILVDPYSISDIAVAMKNISKDRVLRESLIKKGLLRCTEISSMAMAQSMYTIYERGGK